MSPSPGIEPVVALGSDRQTPLPCDEGIDLFVSLQIDPTELVEADLLSWQAGPYAPRPLPAVGDESPFRARVLRNWKPSCEKLTLEELFEDVVLPTPPKDPSDLAQAPNQRSSEPPHSRQVEESQSVPDVRGSGLINEPSAAVLSIAQRYEHQSLNSAIWIDDQQMQEHNDPEQNEQAGEQANENGSQNPCVSEAQCEQARDDGVLSPCVSEGQCSICEHGIPARGTPDEINCRCHQDLEEQDKDQSTWSDEEPYLCKENRKWSPAVLQDYCSTPIELNRSTDIRCTGDQTHQQVQEHNDPEQNEQAGEQANENGSQNPCVSEAQCVQARDNGVLNQCVSEGQCSICEYGIPSHGTPDEINCWILIDLNRSPDNQVSGCTWSCRCTGGRADLGEDVGQVCVNLPSASLPSEKVIESFDIAKISAACQLLKMRECVQKRESSEHDQAVLDAYDIFGSESGALSREGTVSEVRKATDQITSAPVHVPNPGNASRPGANNMELSGWYDDNKYIPRLARRAKRQLRGAKCNTTIDFGNSQSHADPDYSDSEVLRKPPKKLQYKSTRDKIF